MPDLQQKAALYDALLATLPNQAVLLLDPEGVITEWNEALGRLFGYIKDDLVGQSVSVLFTEDDRASGLPKQELQRVFRESKVPYLRWHARQDGSRFRSSGVTAALRDSAGQHIGFAKVFLAEKEDGQGDDRLQQLWRTLDTVLANTPDFTYIFDLEGRFTFINQALLQLWQKPLEEAMGKNFFELDYPLDLAARLQRQIQEVIETRVAVRDETPYTGPTGETRQYEYIFVPVLGGDGGVQAVAGSTRDITDRKRAEQGLTQQVQAVGEELERTNEELRAVAARLITAQEDERRRMARELHDDLAQRLAVMEYQLADLREKVRSDPALVETLLDGLTGLTAGISEDVRQLSHRLHPSVLDDLGLVPALRSLCEEFKRAYGMSVQLETQVPPSWPIPLTIATALYRISQEALRNTAKHARDSSVVIELLTTAPDIRLTIRDSGPGFDPETIRAKGEGLGLISMRERARLVSGTFEVQSSAGAGTEITIHVPLPQERL